MKTYQTIITQAIEKYKPIHALLMFSGGHDSLVSTHVAATYLQQIGFSFSVYHGDTSIGIPETQDYVKSVCERYGWQLDIRAPKVGEQYEDIVAKYGFPGPNLQAHGIMYRRLKERPLRRFVTHEVKSAPRKRENVLLITGIRKAESQIRMGYLHEISKDNSRVWASPIFWWAEQRCERYIKENDLPRNPVKDRLCISGECLCGAFAGREELAEIKVAYPETYARLMELDKIAKANGYPWPWTQGPNEWYKNHPPGQMDMFLCVGCESKRNQP